MNNLNSRQLTTIQDILLPYKQERFALEREPIHVGNTNIINMSRPNTRCLDMLIKDKNSQDIKIPPQYKTYDIVNQCLFFERKTNHAWKQYYLYLTIDQRIVKSNESLRNPGAHFDGMQGKNYNPKISTCHSYLVVSDIPTIFYTHPFQLTHLQEDRHNFFEECERQKDPNHVLTPKPGEIYLQSCYQVHESPFAKEETPRTFFRIEFSKKKFDRDINTRNPNFDYKNWDFKPRTIPNFK